MVISKKLALSCLIGLMLPLLAPIAVTAQSEERATRIAERKEALETRLTTAQQTRLRGRCLASQTVLGNYKQRLEKLEQNRTTAHQKIIDKLNELVTKVGDRADTTDLQTAIDTLKTKMDAFQVALDEYQLAVDDLVALDCVADPTAFQATLQATRAQRVELAGLATEIREHIKTVIKPLLQDLRKSLQDEETN